jgi:hypothetical protein
MDSGPPNSPFAMTGAREIIQLTGGAVPISEEVQAIESFMLSSPSMVFDLSRALVETTCKTILEERGKTSVSSNLNKLLEETYVETSLVPERFAADEKTSEKLTQLIHGFECVIQSISHLRNTFGICSHGRPGSAQSLELAHALLAARSADALVHFLYMAHKFFFAPIKEEGLELGNNPDFNDYIDSLHEPTELLGGLYQASELLFRTDEEAYREALEEFRNTADQLEGSLIDA